MSEVQPDSPQGIYDTLLELRLQNWAHEEDPQVKRQCFHSFHDGCLLLVSFRFFSVFLLGPYTQHMEVPRLGVKLELQLLATATPDLSRVCDLHRSSRQRRILNLLIVPEAGDWTCNLMVPSRFCFRCAMTGTPCWFP